MKLASTTRSRWSKPKPRCRAHRPGATNVGIARAQYEHAIAVLIGKTASDFSIPVKPMTVAPPPIPVGVPSELLERRPDIAAAERTMAEANATIGIAYAAYYPNLTLTGEGGFESSAFHNWLSWPSRFWSVGASLPETIFDAGLRRATVQQYVATYNADLAGYRQTVLTAFQQVEDASCRSPHLIQGNPAGAAGGKFRANIPQAGTVAVRDWH